MDTVGVQEAMRQCWQQFWPEVTEQLEKDVSVESAQQVMRKLMELMRQVCVAGFQAWLEQGDCSADTMEQNGQILRYKMTSPKEFLTPCGTMVLRRRLFQADLGGPTRAPLDEAWGMTDQFATPEVREAATFLMALVTPQEAAQILRKTSLFSLGKSSFKKLAGQFGEWLETHTDAVVAVRAAETVDPQTRVVCASLDGTNVRLAEPGPKPGRPVAGGDSQAPTCFKNAMVGTVSFYGDVPEDHEAPRRLQTRYVSRMPETDSVTFRRQFEAEVADTLARCGPAVTRILVLDAAKSLWSYVESHPQFADFEKLVDFHHSVEHLAIASDSLFTKGSDAATKWLARQRQTLLAHDDGARRVIRAIDHARKRQKLSKAAGTTVSQQRQFFANNGHRMPYATFRSRGLPIGSGPVEAAGKTLVKLRLCRAGMRWTRIGGQHILGSRTLIKSNRWDAVWTRYLKTCGLPCHA